MKKKSTKLHDPIPVNYFRILLIAFTFILLTFQSQISKAQCTASFFPVNDSLNPATVLFFDGSSTTVGIITDYEWNFGDGSPNSTLPNPTHTYPGAGVFNTCLVITTDSACVDTFCAAVTVPNLTPYISINNFGADSSGAYFCTAPAFGSFVIDGIADGFGFNDSVSVFVVYGDGTDTTFYLTIPQRYFFNVWQHTYLNSGTYTPSVIVSNGLVSDTLTATPIIVASNCGPLSGTVYLDNNQDCIFNSGDQTLAGINVSLTDAGTIIAWTQTDSNGVYSFNVPSGTTYEVTLHLNNWYGGTYTIVCPSSGSITVSAVPSSGNDFYVSCPTGFDLTGSVTLSGIVPGRTGNVCVFAYDRYCSTPNGQIKVILDPMLTAMPDSGSTYIISGDTIIWNYSSSTSYWSFCAQVVTATTATIGDTACVTMIIEPVLGDVNPADNIVTTCTAVRTSYDPNDKSAEPFGVGLNHAILPGTEITYTIRFQNTGTAEAYDIYILDTLDQNFDLNTLEILASSHSMVPSILQDNVLRFTFSNIMLPDSNSNEPMSHGYLRYRITPSVGTPDGTVLYNTAGIYFDFNPAVITNTTTHTIDYTLGVKQIINESGIRVSPNPSNEKVIINLLKKGTYNYNLINMLGEVVYTSNNQNQQVHINTSTLPSGIYLIRAENGDEVFQSRMIVSH